MDKKIYKCEICGKEYSTSNKLSRHIGKEHEIDKKEYYDLYLKKDGEEICPVCGAPTRFNNIASGYFMHCSTRCSSIDSEVQAKARRTCIANYGMAYFSNPLQTKQTKLDRYGDANYNNRAKAEQTCLERYGVSNPNQLDTVKQKKEATFLEKYGTKTPCENEDIKNKQKESMRNRTAEEKLLSEQRRAATCIERYGVSVPIRLPEVQKVLEQNNIEKFGVPYPMQNPVILAKMRNTMQQKYGDEEPFHSKESADKIRASWRNRTPESKAAAIMKREQTCLERYGVTAYSQTEQFRRNLQSRYIYDNATFDSSWELLFYIYCKDKGLDIKRTPGRLEYFIEGKRHYYFPDFKVNGVYIEIKGPQFLNDTGELVNPYVTGLTADIREYWEKRDAAKMRCMKENNVKIISDIQKYKTYVESTYGVNYVTQYITIEKGGNTVE